ncbi:hypothetical protein [Bradyrhizobium semiaridum]|uniref:hypothetical protein n=1 Tax=Bradyrhizobium semiaridum TaxID=2821404 RepID=UPI001CE30CBA|nr:hypothetical protein [Bradyrhizobium semiaridum]
MDELSIWIDDLPKREIKPADLEAAEEAWSRRRRIGAIGKPGSKATLFDDLRAQPSTFEGRRTFICVYSEGLSEGGEKALEFYRNLSGLGDQLSAFEWDKVPDFADLICFLRDEEGRFHHDGLFHMPEIRQEVRKFRTKIQICQTIRATAGYPESRLGSAAKWAPALKSLLEDSDDPTGDVLELGAFAGRYLL